MDGLYINDSTKVFNDKDYYHNIFTKHVVEGSIRYRMFAVYVGNPSAYNSNATKTKKTLQEYPPARPT